MIGAIGDKCNEGRCGYGHCGEADKGNWVSASRGFDPTGMDANLSNFSDWLHMLPIFRTASLTRIVDSKRFVWSAIGLLALVQIAMFMQGYRLAADDAGFLQSWMGGYSSIWEAGSIAAHGQGRIGMYVMWPLNAFASYWSGYPSSRFCFVALYFSVFFLFASYMSRLLKRDLTLVLVLLLLVAHPLAFEHMPPNAYSLQNTLPVFLILLARIVLLRTRASSPTAAGRLVACGAMAIFGLATLVSEYALMFGASLVLAEGIFETFVFNQRGARSSRALARILVRERSTDLLILVGVLALYLVFRQMNPSSYDGNHLDGMARPDRLVITAVAHIASGSIFPRLGSDLIQVPPSVWLAALACGVVAYSAARFASRFLQQVPSPGIVSVAALLLALLITLPLAATAKQQAWCLEGGACGYLDSRIAYVWLGLCLLGMAAWCRQAITARAPAMRFDRAFGILAGVVAMLGFAHNWQVAERMSAVSMAWKRADVIACFPQGITPDSGPLRTLIDPRKLVALHPDVDVDDYWRNYVEWGSRQLDCPREIQERQRRLFQLVKDARGPSDVLAFGARVRFSRERGDRFLYANWSSEPWGVWSTDKQANLKVRLPATRNGVYFEFKALRYVPPKSRRPVRIIANGLAVASLGIQVKAENYRVLIPRSVLERSRDGITDIVFLVDDASSPKLDGMSQDTRVLGVGLVEMTFVAAPSR